MDISRIDKNLRIETNLNKHDIVWYDGSQAPFRRYGACAQSVAPFRRLPENVAEETSIGVAAGAKNAAGIRLRFATDSPYIAIKTQWNSLGVMPHFALSGSVGFDLYRVKNGQHYFVGNFLPDFQAQKGYERAIDIPGGVMYEYVLNFPLYNPVDALYIGLKEGSLLTAGEEQYVNSKPVVFYGSSITQGGCASRAGNSYEGFISRALNMDYINLGFSGSCHGEREIAAYMAEMDMAAFVCDYDHNSPDGAELLERHEALYKTVRAKQPTLPYIIVTRPWRTDTQVDRGRLSAIMQTYMHAVEAGDKHVFFVDGGGFFPAGVELDGTVDGCHPTDLGFYFMAQGLIPILRPLL